MPQSSNKNTTNAVARQVLAAAVPVMLGYLVIGIPCGLLSASAGLTPWMCFVLSCTFYSGAGQFMLANMLLAGLPLYSIVASVSFVSTRQILYSAAFSRYFGNASRLLSFLFAATVTDESFGVNLDRFESDEGWTAGRALAVNVACMLSWTVANVVGAALGAVVSLPLAVTSFAMTSIFICLLAGQPLRRPNVIAMAVAALGVLACKLVGLTGPAILVGALAGVAAGLALGGERS